MIALSEPYINGNEWKYVKECLDTGWVSSVGGYVSRFENMLAEYIEKKYAIATVNGSSALHASLIACEVEPGDEVIVPTLTFIAPVNAVKYCGANPLFTDCDPDTLCMDVNKVAAFLEEHALVKENGFTYNKKTKRRIKAVIPVHAFGHPVEMDRLVEICNSKNIDIIEDATESLGSLYKGKKTGSFGKIGCFSFNGNKIITTGGGGMVVTDNETLAKRIRHISTQAKSDSIEYDHDEIGYNYRLTNIQAAVGVAQMERLNQYIETKRKNAALYKKLIEKVNGATFLWEKPETRSNFWFYTIRVEVGHKNPLIKYLLSRDIQVRPIWKLMHELPMYKSCERYAIDSAPESYRRCLNIPCSVNIKREHIEYVIECIKEYFEKKA